jgi:type III pantothenate kinase
LDAIDNQLAGASLLILEIGNSHASVATSVSGKIYTHQRFGLDQVGDVVAAGAESWAALPDDRPRAIAAAGVVPSALKHVRDRLSAALSHPIMVVGEELHRPLSLALESPASVGIDRVCSAAAAFDTLQHACAVASFGTAITIDCVNDEGVFMGGSILPGVNMQARSLHEWTAQLPLVTIKPPAGVYGGSTADAISSGVVFGIVGGLREIVERYATALGAWPELIATGGQAELISEHSNIIDRVVPDLCIRGIALAFRKHFSPLEAME